MDSENIKWDYVVDFALTLNPLQWSINRVFQQWYIGETLSPPPTDTPVTLLAASPRLVSSPISHSREGFKVLRCVLNNFIPQGLLYCYPGLAGSSVVDRIRLPEPQLNESSALVIISISSFLPDC